MLCADSYTFSYLVSRKTRLGIYAILRYNFGRCLCQFMCSCNVYKNVFKKTLNEAMKVKLELQWNLQNAIVSEPWNIHKARKQAWTRPSLWAMLTVINKCEEWNYPRPLTQSITILNPLQFFFPAGFYPCFDANICCYAHSFNSSIIKSEHTFVCCAIVYCKYVIYLFIVQ